jgi:predicted TPR repeat methyltransferase
MKNPIVAMGHALLKNQVAYDAYQFCVGGVKYRNKLISSLNSQVTKNFLDLGCGTAAISELMPKHVAYFGVDQSQNYLEKAKLRKPDGAFSLSDVCDAKWLEDLTISGPTVASALGLYHHLSDDQVLQLLKICKLVLGKGGVLFSVDPVITQNSSSIARWFAQNDRGKFVRSPEHLESLLLKSGFSVQVVNKSNEFRMPLDTIEISATLN